MTEIILLAVLGLLATSSVYLVPALDGRNPWAKDTPRFFQISISVAVLMTVAITSVALLGYTF